MSYHHHGVIPLSEEQVFIFLRLQVPQVWYLVVSLILSKISFRTFNSFNRIKITGESFPDKLILPPNFVDVFSPAAYMMAKAAREQVQAAVAALDDDHCDMEMKQDGMTWEFSPQLFLVPCVKI